MYEIAMISSLLLSSELAVDGREWWHCDDKPPWDECEVLSKAGFNKNVLHQATAHSIVSLMHAAVPHFYHYYPVSGHNSLRMWFAIVVTFPNDNWNVLKRSRSLVSLWETEHVSCISEIQFHALFQEHQLVKYREPIPSWINHHYVTTSKGCIICSGTWQLRWRASAS